jgi:hypothetical protein
MGCKINKSFWGLNVYVVWSCDVCGASSENNLINRFMLGPYANTFKEQKWECYCDLCLIKMIKHQYPANKLR